MPESFAGFLHILWPLSFHDLLLISPADAQMVEDVKKLKGALPCQAHGIHELPVQHKNQFASASLLRLLFLLSEAHAKISNQIFT
jgi:hypothetical protein